LLSLIKGIQLFHILYVDDEPALLETGKIFLELSGRFKVDVQESAVSSLPLLASGKYDAIVSDYQMPAMDGIEFLKKVRQAGNTIPFVLFTGKGREEVVIQALNEGADFYLQKGGALQPQFTELEHHIIEAVKRKQAERSLRENEIQLRATLEATADGILAVDNNGNVLNVNPRFAEIWQIPKTLLDRRNDPELLNFVLDKLKDPEDFLKKVNELYNSDSADRDTLVFRDGRIVERYSSPIMMDGIRIGRVWSFRDITEQKRGDEALKASEEKFHGIFDMINDAVHIHEIGPDGYPGRFIEVNEIACKMVHYTREELLRRAPLDFVSGNHSRPLDQIIHELRTKGHAVFETEHMRKDGVPVPVEINTHVVNLQGQRVMVSVVRDITRRKESEKALRESEERLSTILNAAQVGIILVDADSHKIIQANPKALEMIDAQEHDVTGAVCHKFICPADQGKCPVTDLGQVVNSSERVLITKNGTLIPIVKTVVATRIGDRKVLIESFFDITDRKRADVALRESEEKYRRLADNAPDMVYRMSVPSGIYQYVSPAAFNITGYSPEEFYKNPYLINSLLTEEWQDYFRKERDALLRGEMSPIYEYQIRDRSGKIRWLNQRNVLIRNERAIPIAIEGIVTDITDRKQIEQALQQANRKLKLLSGITRHDINNQLTALVGYLDLMDKRQGKDSDGIRKMNEAADRIRAMIQFTREYEEIGVNAPGWHDCRDLIDEAVHNLPLGLVNVKNDIQAGTEIFADPLIVKVCYNLLDNALRYGEHLTTIHFSAKNEEGNHIIVCEDNGVGIPVDEKERIFLQGYGQNTGMGLFLVREILSITDITIRETGSVGNGARFEIAVPNGAFRLHP